MFLLFFKQKTSYEMRISDWSSDVCSSDLLIRAVLMMVVSAMLFGAMAIIIRLASQQLHPFQIAFFRNLFGLLFALPLLLRHGPGLLHTNKLPLYFLRCSIGIVSMLAGFWAIVNLPLAPPISLSYSTPLFFPNGALLDIGRSSGREKGC